MKRVGYPILLLSLIVACTKQITKQTPSAKDKIPVHVMTKGDTTEYVIGFTGKKELKSFIRTFEHFIKEYSIDTVVSDTIHQYFCFKFVPLPKDTLSDLKHTITKLEKLDFIETDLEIPVAEAAIPDTGGKAVIYTDRNFVDNTLSELLNTLSFIYDSSSQKEADSCGLIINQLTPKKIHITCTDKLIDNTAKHLTSFDVVQSWTDFIKNNPAEGSAIFLHVKGLNKFIRGEEGIIQGFSVSNEKTIIITLEQPDPFAIQRLNSPKLLPPSLKNGPLYIKKKQDNKYFLAKNPNYPYTKSFLDECIIICGNDKNPIVSYSLNKYDLFFLYKKNDIAYSRQSLSKNSELLHIATDRYFCSLASESLPLRKYISDLINPLEIQTNTIKAEGEVITEIESLEPKPAAEKNTSITPPPNVTTPITIIYNTDDPVSTNIAEKVFSDLSHANIPCKLNGLNKHSLDAALLDRSYDIAIGWVSDKIISNRNEKLRLATIWFNDETNEETRISGYCEVPLFTILRYALYKKNIKLYKNLLSGIYRKAE